MPRRHALGTLLVLAMGLVALGGRHLPAPALLLAAPLATWTQVTTSGGQAALALAANQVPTPHLYAGTFETFPAGGLYVSTNGGATWTNPLPIPVASAATSPTTPTLAYAGGFFDGFWRSPDGTTWTDHNAGLSASIVPAILPTTGVTLYLGTDTGVFLSEDGGDTWFPTGSGIPPGSIVLALAQDGEVIVAGTDTGAFRSIDAGSSWLDANAGLSAASVRALLKAGTVLHAATDTGVFTSTTQGADWTSTSASLAIADAYALAASHRVPRVLIAGGTSGIFVSSDHGATWQPGATTGLTGPAASINALATTGYPFETLYAATNAGVWQLASLFDLGCAALPDAAFGANPTALDASDLAAAAAHWHTPYDQTFDLDEDGQQTIADLMRSAVAFGATCSP